MAVHFELSFCGHSIFKMCWILTYTYVTVLFDIHVVEINIRSRHSVRGIALTTSPVAITGISTAVLSTTPIPVVPATPTSTGPEGESGMVRKDVEGLFMDRGSLRELNARNVCCRQVFVHLLFTVCLPPRNNFNDESFPNYGG